jgi:hypothetical protein
MRPPIRWASALCLGWLLLSPADGARPGEPEAYTSIAEIEARPDAFHLRQVAMKGRVHDVRQLDPYFQPSGTACTGAYLFTLQDETGFLRIAVLGVCGVPIARSLEVSEDDEVIVKVVIQAPGRLEADHPIPPHAVASEIKKVKRDK